MSNLLHISNLPNRGVIVSSSPRARSTSPRAAMATPEAESGAESPIAAFVVAAKGGVVLKHIFLNGPPTGAARRGGDGDENGDRVEEDPPVLIDHPSVSSRHLEVRCKRRQRRITVSDLSSVHGTCISGQRIPPNTLLELVVGLQLGASKREYRLHWLSPSEAFDMEDLLPPLVEEDKEEIHAHQETGSQLVPGEREPMEMETYKEACYQLVPGKREPMDTEAHQETKHQVVSEQSDCWPKVIRSAPPLPAFTHAISLEESPLSHFHDNREEVRGEKIVSENLVIESVDSSIIQAAGTPLQSDKQKASGILSRRAKLKSVKSLHIDTGRRSRTLSYSHKKEAAQCENLVCSQNCKVECAACMVLFDNLDVKAGEKEKMIAPEKDHIKPLVMEGNEEVRNSVPPGKYDAAISLAKQGDLFLDENVAPAASRDLKPIAAVILDTRMDSSVPAEFTSNRSIHQGEHSELSSEYDATSPARQQNIFPDKENVTPASKGLKSNGRKVLGSRVDSSVLAEYTSNSSNDLSSKSKRFHTVDDEHFYSDKENLTPISTGGMKARSCLPKNLFPVDAEQDQEAFCSNKENSTPASSVAQKTRNVSENRARIESAITKKRVADRLLFQTLLSNSLFRSTSSFDSTQVDAKAANFSVRLEDELNSIPPIKLDPADSLLHAHVTTDSVTPWPNWREANGSTTGGNVHEAVGSGLTGSRQAIVAQEPANNVVQIFVKILDYTSIPIQLECNSLIREMVYAASVKCHIHLQDVYVKCNGRIVSPESSLVLNHADCTFIIVPRLRGGAPGDPNNTMDVHIEFIPLRDYIISVGESLFEVVYFRDQWPKWTERNYIVFLGEAGRKIYKMLFELIEYYHGKDPQQCVRKSAYVDAFTIDNIVYHPQHRCLSFIGVEVRPFSKGLYLNNVLSITQILEDMFRYNPSKLSPRRHPNIHELNKRISVLPRLLELAVDDTRANYYLKKDSTSVPPDAGLTKNSREVFLLDPAGKSSSERIADIQGVDLHYDYLKVKGPFIKCLGSVQNDWFTPMAKIPPMERVLKFPCFYDHQKLAWLPYLWNQMSVCHCCKFGRNWVTHSECGSATEAEAIFTCLNPKVMRQATKAILCNYTEPPAPGGLAENRTKLADVLRRK